MQRDFPIIEGLDFHTYAGIGTAVDGMKTACGAKLIATQQRMVIDDGGSSAAAPATPSTSAATAPTPSSSIGKRRPAMSDAAATLDANATVKTVPVSTKREVCYEFDTKATDAGVAIPYLVSINGKIQSKLGKLDGTRKIKRIVDIGSKVALYLNSDVHPDHRSTPVYAVEVGNNNVLIRITEQTGQHADLRPVIGQPSTHGSPGLDCYQAPLTGNIWMAISHRYSEAEAQKWLATDTPAEVRQAVCNIYRGLKSARLQIPLPGAQRLNIAFEEGGNAQENIAGISTTTDARTENSPVRSMTSRHGPANTTIPYRFHHRINLNIQTKTSGTILTSLTTIEHTW
jgi:hypothetical protein